MAKVTLDKNGLAKSAVTLTIYNFNAVAASLLAQTKSIWRRVVGLPANACITQAGHPLARKARLTSEAVTD